GTAGGGLNSLDPATGKWTRYTHDPNNPASISSNIVWSLLADRDGGIWAGTWDRGLNRLNQAGNVFTRFIHVPDDPKSIGDNKIVQIYEDSRKRIWITHREAGQYGLEMLDRETERFIRFGGPSGESKSQGNAASGTHTLSSGAVSTVFEDPVTGILWAVNTYAGVIDKMDPQSNKFALYQHHPDQPKGISSSQAGVFLEDSRGRFWISVKGSLERFNRETGTFIHYPNKTIHPDMGMMITAIIEDNDGMFWMLDFGKLGGLIKVDPDRMKAVKRYSHDPLNPKSFMANTMPGPALVQDRDSKDILWIGTSSGLEKFNKRTETFTHFVHDPSDPESITKGTVWSLWDDGGGSLWVSTFGGLNRLDKKTGRFTRYVHDPTDPHSTGFNKHSAVFEDSRGNFWVAGLTDGINRMDRRTGKFTRFSRKNGFPATGVNRTIQEDGDGNLWIGTTDAGLIKFNIDRASVEKIYTQSDGLHGNYLWRSYKTRDGTLWFSGPAGLNSIRPDQLRDNPLVPPVVFTDFSQGGEPMPLGTAPEFVREIRLDWRDNYFEFRFAALNYTKPDKNRYAYTLSGVDRGWYQAGNKPFGRYTGLKGGTYQLKIKGSNNDGIWNETGATVRIVVSSPFWQTTWFYLVSAALLAGVIIYLTANRRTLLSEIRERRQAQEALSASQKQFALAMEASRDGIFDWDLTTGKVYFSPAWKGMLGYKDDDLANDPAVWERLTAPEDIPHLREMAGLLISGRLDRLEVEFRMLHRKGHWVDILSRATAIQSPSGKATRIVGTHVDITSRKLAEKKISSLQTYLSRIIESMPSVLIGVDREGRVTLWNSGATRVTGRPMVKAKGRFLSDILPDYPGMDDLIRQAFSGNTPCSRQRVARSLGEGTVYENITVFPLDTEETDGAVIRIDDISDQIKMEEVMIQSEKMMSVGGLAAGMAHEINNPLAGMIQSAGVMRSRLTARNMPANQKAADSAGTTMDAVAEFMELRRIPAMLEAISESGMRMAGIVDNMLSFARQGDASVSSRNPAEILDKSLALAATDYDLKKHYDFKSIEIIKEYAPDLPMILCEPSKIQQVIMNILNNGAYAMGQSPDGPPPKFTLRLRPDNDMLRIDIEDNGPGMDLETRKRLFEPFFTTKPEGIGTGLGLSVSYFIVTEHHKGTLEVISEPGQGSCFIIRLPLSPN
ncbi:MAG: PAS domain S-box protein, partial [Desulfobacterales bacterium]|nr:PAS domain S-box protein [Desulfobacterales bacterium]